MFKKTFSILLVVFMIMPISGTVLGANNFKDVNVNDWFYYDVNFVLDKGLFKGVSDTHFAPEAPITRGMLAIVLGRYDNANVENYKNKNSFSDIDSSEYCHGYIEWANEKGIIKGMGDGTFHPHEEITRQDLAVMLFRYIHEYKGWCLMSIEFGERFGSDFYKDDAQIAPYADLSIGALSVHGILEGFGYGVFVPLASVTRAQTAKILHVIDKEVAGIFQIFFEYVTIPPCKDFYRTDKNGKLTQDILDCTASYSIIYHYNIYNIESTFDGWWTAPIGGTRVTQDTVFTQKTTLYPRHKTLE